ncbi:MAG: hypothetical protein HOM58_17470 [Rhodospirillaceae bacterium]|nr:hypothetical protein [Rhodospirillaceae bacterium]
MMQAYYALPPEHYGFARERKYSNTESPWAINNIHDHPQKKAFMDKAVTWVKSWQKLVDRGFDNELRREAVQAHPRFDGMAAPPAPAPPKPMVSANPAASQPKPAKQSPAQIAKLTPPPAARIADGPLSPEKLQTAISGKMAYGEGVQSNAEITFGRRGTIDGRTTLGSTDYEDSGQWSVDKTGRLCLKWNVEEFLSNTCYSATKRSNKFLFKDDSGETIFVITLPKNSASNSDKLAPPPKLNMPDGSIDPAVIENIIVGKEAAGVAGIDNSAIEFLPRGRLDGRHWARVTEFHDQGTWKMDGSGRLCLDWEKHELSPDACYHLIKQGKAILMQDGGDETQYIFAL